MPISPALIKGFISIICILIERGAGNEEAAISKY